ncbi:MAG TPA: response regulator transcription factor [Candidatus Acidoferrum sp.]|jgi:DNA-binding NarL/FixJ family response regulator
MNTVLIVDDNALIRSGVRRILEASSTWTVCGEAESGRGAMNLAEELKPDVIVMDMSMPGIDGLEATQSIKNRLPNAKVLLLTVHISKQLAEIAFRAGVNGYLVKAATRQELIRALDTISQGRIYVSPAILSAGNENWSG